MASSPSRHSWRAVAVVAAVGAALLASVVASTPGGAARTAPAQHVWVEPGDTWTTVAAECGSTAAAIRTANYLASNAALRANSWLHCPLVVPPTTTTTLPATTTTTVAPTTTAATTTSVVATTTTVPPAGGFLETFDSVASLDRFDFYVANGRDMGSTPPTAWHGDHSSGQPCGNALTGRTVNWPDHPWGADGIQRLTDPGELVYWCAPGGAATGHMMTSFNTNGYAHVDFTPRQSFNNVTKVCWDVNATNLGNRKWVQVAVVPEAIFQANNRRLDYIHPGFNPGPGEWGLGVAGVALVTTTQGSVTGFGTLAGDHYAIHLGNADKTTRYQNCLYQNGTVTQAFPGGVRTVDLAGSLPTGPVRVIFQDASYHPDKAVGESPATVSNGYAWHWDRIIVEAG